MTAAVVALAIALAGVSVAGVVGVVTCASWARKASAAELAAAASKMDAQAVATRAMLAADTADSMRAASEQRVAKLEAALRLVTTEGTSDANDHTLMFRDRASAVAYANSLLSAANAGAGDAASADRGNAGSGHAVSTQPVAAAAGGAIPGVPRAG